MIRTTTPFEAWQEPPAEGELRLIPIGGLGEFGMNALVVHTARSLFLVDCGQLFPSDDQPGIDSIVPDFAYLEPYAHQIDAVLLTHGHEDHLGALPYFLERWPVPVYGTAFTLGLLEGKLREFEIKTKGLLHVVSDFERLPIGAGEIEAEWIPVTHSIPDACAIVLHTPQGVIVHTGDYKLDKTPIDGRLTGLKRLTALGQGRRRACCSRTPPTSCGPGPTPSEAICREGLRDAFQKTPGQAGGGHLQLQHPSRPDPPGPGLRGGPQGLPAGAVPGAQHHRGPGAEAAQAAGRSLHRRQGGLRSSSPSRSWCSAPAPRARR